MAGQGVIWREFIARYAPGAVSLLIGAVAWEVAGDHMSHAFLVPLSETIVRMGELILAGELVQQSLSSLSLFAVGFVLALLVGAPAGLLLARVPVLRRALDLYIMIIYATPLVAIIPFILSLMGFGFAPKVLVVFLFAVFPILYNTVEGARSVKPELLEVARSFRSSEWSLWRDVMIPYTLPFTMTGVRQAIGRALVGMIAAEFFLSSTGLGQLIMVASQNFDTGAMLAAISVIVVLGLGLMRLGVAIENHFARWRV
jgi:ABC-type nitrate/sulfonate/bicarbonate transport system permease component